MDERKPLAPGSGEDFIRKQGGVPKVGRYRLEPVFASME